MDWIQTLLVAFVFSFIGSIPPGSINLSVIQLSLTGLMPAALRFALAAMLVEFVYAYVAIEFQFYITSSALIQNNFKIITIIVLMLLGVINLLPRGKGKIVKKLETSGFRKGTLISIANPLAIPFWIAITAYLQANGWVNLTKDKYIPYILGVGLGTFALLALLAVLSGKVSGILKNQELARKVPGLILLGLGLYSLTGFLADLFSR